MNAVVVGVMGVAAAGAIYVFAEPQPADVYDMPVADAYAALSKSDLGLAEAKDWVGLETSNTGNGRDQLIWEKSSSHSRTKCQIDLSKFEGDAARTHVAINCNMNAPASGAASGMVHNISRNIMIERIDALLTGREFDKERAGQTAYRWPSDGVDGSYSTAVGKALEMDREVQKMQAEFREKKQEPAAAGYDAADGDWGEQ